MEQALVRVLSVASGAPPLEELDEKRARGKGKESSPAHAGQFSSRTRLATRARTPDTGGHSQLPGAGERRASQAGNPPTCHPPQTRLPGMVLRARRPERSRLSCGVQSTATAQ